MVNASELGWLAGIIDGEGSICCKVGAKSRRSGRLYTMPCPCINIQNTSKAMVDEISRRLSALEVRHIVAGPFMMSRSTKAVYRCDVNRKPEQFKLLTIIGPLLVAKKSQAKFVIAWLDKWKQCAGRGKVTPSDDERLFFASTLRQMNAA